MLMTPLTRASCLSPYLCLCLLPACSVIPDRSVSMAPDLQVAMFSEAEALPGTSPQSHKERERKQKQDQERQAQRDSERRARKKRRAADRQRRKLEAQRDREHRDDPDWPQNRNDRPRRDRHRDRDRDRDQRDSGSGHTYFLFSWADGDYDVEDGQGTHDKSANMYRIRAGATNRHGTGGGVDIKFYNPRHDINPGTVMSTNIDQPDIYPFFTTRLGRGRFNIPLRIGPYYNLLSAQQNSTGRYTSYNNIGIRLELEPTLDLTQQPDVTLQAYASLSAGAHFTYIDDEITRENYTSNGTVLSLEPGLRLIVKNFVLSAAYHLNESTVRKSSRERDRKGTVRELHRVETDFQGFMFTFGFRF